MKCILCYFQDFFCAGEDGIGGFIGGEVKPVDVLEGFESGLLA